MSRNKEFDFDSLPQGSKDVYELRLKAPDLTRLADVVRMTCGDTVSPDAISDAIAARLDAGFAVDPSPGGERRRPGKDSGGDGRSSWGRIRGHGSHLSHLRSPRPFQPVRDLRRGAGSDASGVLAGDAGESQTASTWPVSFPGPLGEHERRRSDAGEGLPACRPLHRPAQRGPEQRHDESATRPWAGRPRRPGRRRMLRSPHDLGASQGLSRPHVDGDPEIGDSVPLHRGPGRRPRPSRRRGLLRGLANLLAFLEMAQLPAAGLETDYEPTALRRRRRGRLHEVSEQRAFLLTCGFARGTAGNNPGGRPQVRMARIPAFPGSSFWPAPSPHPMRRRFSPALDLVPEPDRIAVVPGRCADLLAATFCFQSSLRSSYSTIFSPLQTVHSSGRRKNLRHDDSRMGADFRLRGVVSRAEALVQADDCYPGGSGMLRSPRDDLRVHDTL